MIIVRLFFALVIAIVGSIMLFGGLVLIGLGALALTIAIISGILYLIGAIIWILFNAKRIKCTHRVSGNTESLQIIIK